MVNKLEKGLAIDIGMTDCKEMVQIFDLAKALQLPVVDKGKVIGLISIFDICHNMEEKIDVREIMTTDFQIAGAEDGVFSSSNSRQFILPFVNEEGHLEGFINRIALKCYLPNEEYLEVINEGLDKLFNEAEHTELLSQKQLADLRKSFDVILEDNYDGIFLTLGKGDTISINDRAMLIDGAKLSDVAVKDEKAVMQQRALLKISVSCSIYRSEKNSACRKVS